jgi:hypothetical protein
VLYGAVSDANWVRYGPSTDSLVRTIAWTQDDALGVRVTVGLSLPVWGYRVRYDRGDLLLEIHRPPPLDPAHPLRNVLIVVDPGHPPVGATGPTGLWEPVPNLGIGLKLRDLLVRAGARVAMTRTTDSAVDLTRAPASLTRSAPTCWSRFTTTRCRMASIRSPTTAPACSIIILEASRWHGRWMRRWCDGWACAILAWAEATWRWCDPRGCRPS